MHVTLVEVHVKAQHVDAFIDATRINHEQSTKDPGTMRFDVLQSDDPTQFILYEAFATEQDAALHKGTPHYKKWRDAVSDWMASPREGVIYACLYPK